MIILLNAMVAAQAQSPAGISWLQRWAIAQGKTGEFFKGEPRAPEFVLKVAGIDAK